MTATRRRQTVGVALVLIVLFVAGTMVLVQQTLFGSWRVTAHFTSATAIYPGDEVRVVGVKVGTIAAIDTVYSACETDEAHRQGEMSAAG